MKRILLCDDAPTVLKLMDMILTEEGYKVQKSVNATEALATIAKEGYFDLGIFDVNMPGKNGIELAREVIASDKEKKMKIMIVSTETSDHFREEGRKAGVSAWITKPYDDEELLEVVQALIGK